MTPSLVLGCFSFTKTSVLIVSSSFKGVKGVHNCLELKIRMPPVAWQVSLVDTIFSLTHHWQFGVKKCLQLGVRKTS